MVSLATCDWSPFRPSNLYKRFGTERETTLGRPSDSLLRRRRGYRSYRKKTTDISSKAQTHFPFLNEQHKRNGKWAFVVGGLLSLLSSFSTSFVLWSYLDVTVSLALEACDQHPDTNDQREKMKKMKMKTEVVLEPWPPGQGLGLVNRRSSSLSLTN